MVCEGVEMVRVWVGWGLLSEGEGKDGEIKRVWRLCHCTLHYLQ